MAEGNHLHVSSAVISVKPEDAQSVMEAISAFEGTEIFAHEGGRIVVVMEGASSAELGSRLGAIGTLDGVVAANMVFEHIDEPEVTQP